MVFTTHPAQCGDEAGTPLTDADINELCKEFESESWTGHLERIHYGPALAGMTPLEKVSPISVTHTPRACGDDPSSS